jgi:hypothetical protein
VNVHRERPPKTQSEEGLPRWLNITVVLTLLGSFVYNLVIVGPSGYPTNVIIGGLLGGYIGVDKLVKKQKSGGSDGGTP